ncbi:MAG: hypothetical protein V7L25_07160 [Nostoc sp.]|uniref:hypothetical protein n=1 Tax=Nostoc sp. TaxID=1180 RepID=UPI002FF1D0A9
MNSSIGVARRSEKLSQCVGRVSRLEATGVGAEASDALYETLRERGLALSVRVSVS